MVHHMTSLCVCRHGLDILPEKSCPEQVLTRVVDVPSIRIQKEWPELTVTQEIGRLMG